MLVSTTEYIHILEHVVEHVTPVSAFDARVVSALMALSSVRVCTGGT